MSNIVNFPAAPARKPFDILLDLTRTKQDGPELVSVPFVLEDFNGETLVDFTLIAAKKPGDDGYLLGAVEGNTDLEGASALTPEIEAMTIAPARFLSLANLQPHQCEGKRRGNMLDLPDSDALITLFELVHDGFYVEAEKAWLATLAHSFRAPEAADGASVSFANNDDPFHIQMECMQSGIDDYADYPLPAVPGTSLCGEDMHILIYRSFEEEDQFYVALRKGIIDEDTLDLGGIPTFLPSPADQYLGLVERAIDASDIPVENGNAIGPLSFLKAYQFHCMLVAGYDLHGSEYQHDLQTQMYLDPDQEDVYAEKLMAIHKSFSEEESAPAPDSGQKPQSALQQDFSEPAAPSAKAKPPASRPENAAKPQTQKSNVVVHVDFKTGRHP